MSTLTFVRHNTGLIALAKLIIYGPKRKYFSASEKLIAFRQKLSKDKPMHIIKDKETSKIIQQLLKYKQKKLNEQISNLAITHSRHLN